MKGRLTRSKVSPKSHKKIVAFVYAEKLTEDDIPKMEYYFEKRKDLHFIYLVVLKQPSKNVITVCNRYNHLKVIYSNNQDIQIADIKKQFDGTGVTFKERKFEDLKDRSL
ncbi:MAG: hypothetical protein H8D22_07745 [Candidatus Cloacimonetes bacterium]|nr:hypothetical protein [Candidatus Cloacimonadota bacterium]